MVKNAGTRWRAALGVAIGAMLALGAGTGAAPAQDKKVLRVVMHSGLRVTDPIITTAYMSRNHGYMIYDTLFAMNDKFEIKPQMAKEFTVSPDKLTYTITLRDGLKFHDGSPVTTTDVIASLRRWMTIDAMAKKVAAVTTAMTAVDDKTFVIHWDKFRCGYDSINDFLPLPEHLERPVFESDPAQYRMRTLYDTDRTNPGLYFGPYRITRVESGAYVMLEQNPTWWGEKPSFNRIVVRTIENTSAMEANLLSGEVDFVAGEVGLSIEPALAFEKRNG